MKAVYKSGLAVLVAMFVIVGTAEAATIFNSTDVPKAIPPSGTFGTTTSTLTIGGGEITGLITDVNLTLDITHTWDGDLRIDVMSPSSTWVLLVNRRGSFGDNFRITTFDDEAGTAITAGSAPFNGTFSPEGLLSGFDGENPVGTWTLQIQDLACLDAGTLHAWSLEIETDEAYIPEPATLGFLVIGAAAAFYGRKRR